MPPISVLIKPASGLCNMSCDYCFYCDEARNRSQASYGFMTEDTLKNVIRRTLPRAEYSIGYAFQGGEPTLCGIPFFEKVLFYQKKYNKNGIAVSNALQTNGYAIDEEWCRFFRDHHILVGLSIDGTDETHNRLRHTRDGKDSFQKVLHAAALFDRFGVEYNILTVVTSSIAANVQQIYDYYRRQGWHYQQYIACLDPLDEARGTQSYSLTPQMYGKFLIELFDLWYQDFLHGKQPYIRQFENFVGLAAGYNAEACEQSGTCGIQYVVEADGSVYPCDFYALDQWRLGSLNTDNLQTIDEQRRKLHFIERSEQLDPSCRNCSYYRLCRGGCQRCRDLSSSTSLYTNYFCQAYRTFFDHSYNTIMDIAKKL